MFSSFPEKKVEKKKNAKEPAHTYNRSEKQEEQQTKRKKGITHINCVEKAKGIEERPNKPAE